MRQCACHDYGAPSLQRVAPYRSTALASACTKAQAACPEPQAGAAGPAGLSSTGRAPIPPVELGLGASWQPGAAELDGERVGAVSLALFDHVHLHRQWNGRHSVTPRHWHQKALRQVAFCRRPSLQRARVTIVCLREGVNVGGRAAKLRPTPEDAPGGRPCRARW